MSTIAQAQQVIAAAQELAQISKGLAALAAMASANVTIVTLDAAVPGYVNGQWAPAARVSIPVDVAQATTFLTNRQAALQTALTSLGFTG